MNGDPMLFNSPVPVNLMLTLILLASAYPCISGAEPAAKQDSKNESTGHVNSKRTPANDESEDYQKYGVVGIYNTSNNQYCTGAVINSRLIISSAYCVIDRLQDSDIEVRLGSNISEGTKNYKTIIPTYIYVSRNFTGRGGPDVLNGIVNTPLALMVLSEALPSSYKSVADISLFSGGTPTFMAGYGGGDGDCWQQKKFRTGNTRVGLLIGLPPYHLNVGQIQHPICLADIGAPLFYKEPNGDLYLLGFVYNLLETSLNGSSGAFAVDPRMVKIFINEFYSDADPNILKELKGRSN
jgi:hypothetical protein